MKDGGGGEMGWPSAAAGYYSYDHPSLAAYGYDTNFPQAVSLYLSLFLYDHPSLAAYGYDTNIPLAVSLYLGLFLYDHPSLASYGYVQIFH